MPCEHFAGKLGVQFSFLPAVCRMLHHFSPVRLFATPWTISMEFSRPEYWSGWPFLSPGDLPNPGIEPRSPTWQADSLPAEPQGKPKSGSTYPFSSPGDLPNPGIEPGLLHCRRILYQLSYQGSPQEGRAFRNLFIQSPIPFQKWKEKRAERGGR